MILLEFAGQPLALTDEEFEAARERGLRLMPVPGSAVLDDEILDAQGMEAQTNVPATWWLEAARQGTVPHLKIGKYTRFSLREALEQGSLFILRLPVHDADPEHDKPQHDNG